MREDDKRQALERLGDPKLLDRVLAGFERCGVVGETRTRRDHMKSLTLIRSIALLHKYQRRARTGPPRSEASRRRSDSKRPS